MLGNNQQAFWDQGNRIFDQMMAYRRELVKSSEKMLIEVWLLEDGSGQALHQNDHLLVFNSEANALAYMDDRHLELAPKRWGLKKLQ